VTYSFGYAMWRQAWIGFWRELGWALVITGGRPSLSLQTSARRPS